MADSLTTRERVLTEALDEANETIRQHRSRARPLPRSRWWTIHFSRSEASVLQRLTRGGIWTSDRLRGGIDTVTGEDGQSSVKSVNVTVCRLRKKLVTASRVEGALPISIETQWGGGYSMDAESIAALAAFEVPGPGKPVPSPMDIARDRAIVALFGFSRLFAADDLTRSGAIIAEQKAFDDACQGVAQPA